jgi:hypothetical protein
MVNVTTVFGSGSIGFFLARRVHIIKLPLDYTGHRGTNDPAIHQALVCAYTTSIMSLLICSASMILQKRLLGCWQYHSLSFVYLPVLASKVPKNTCCPRTNGFDQKKNLINEIQFDVDSPYTRIVLHGKDHLTPISHAVLSGYYIKSGALH